MAIKLPTVLTGNGVPSNSLDGRYYRDTSNGDFYDKINGVWVKREPLIYMIHS